MKIVIVGAVAGGASAAARARRLAESADIVLFERGTVPSFANCGMPYYVGGEIQDRAKLLVTPPERLRRRYRLDLRLQTEVVAIDRVRQIVVARDLTTGHEYEESYDKLILSTGAAPLRPALPGSDHPQIYTLRELRDSDRIKAAIDRGVSDVLIVGAGFIGLEMAENCVRRSLKTTIVERSQQILPPWDAEMTTAAVAHLRQHHIDLRLGDQVVSYADEGGRVRVTYQSGSTQLVDFVILSVGVKPENSLAIAAGLDVGTRGGIRVNEYLQTSDPRIYAVGDAIEVRDFVLGEPTQIPLAGPANRQGRLAADHVCNHNPPPYRGTQGTAILRLFEMTVAMTGASEKSLRQAGREYRKVYLHPAQHAGYYPGAEAMTIKLLFAPTNGQILGAQIAGGEGVDKRIDVLAVAIQARLSVFDLEHLELAYSPQFGSAKDPINMAGFIAAGLLRGDHPQIAVDELPTLAVETSLVDVRMPSEFQAGSIPGAVNIPVDDLRDRLHELPLDRPLVVYCQVGMRGYLATRILTQHGYQVRNLSGGYRSYQLATG